MSGPIGGLFTHQRDCWISACSSKLSLSLQVRKISLPDCLIFIFSIQILSLQTMLVIATITVPKDKKTYPEISIWSKNINLGLLGVKAVLFTLHLISGHG